MATNDQDQIFEVIFKQCEDLDERGDYLESRIQTILADKNMAFRDKQALQEQIANLQDRDEKLRNERADVLKKVIDLQDQVISLKDILKEKIKILQEQLEIIEDRIILQDSPEA